MYLHVHCLQPIERNYARPTANEGKGEIRPGLDGTSGNVYTWPLWPIERYSVRPVANESTGENLLELDGGAAHLHGLQVAGLARHALLSLHL